ncbi:MAG: gamma-glutamyl-gamma-aminobutyrate hydrolase family protein [Balneolaceae bacterium]|nr:gamma-glutamyl-gamma-aminobutyrate hydrolase family protein [Balneolaceae bacterium]MCH8549866.1 gamma-glutamyl-gamma-aminobutyrate hydrolase family protein [Balneolaceae bacterium]
MKSRKRPVIGVTGPDEGGTGAWLFTALSVRLAGGKPRRITVKNPCDIDDIDGLILGGGADVEPLKYGQQRIEKATLAKNSRTIFEWILSILFFPIYWLARYFQHTKSAPIDTDRDELELGLLKDALSEKKPVLGICRGMQLMNVHFKGNLHQDIRGFYTEAPQVSSIFPKKRVEIKEGSRLAEILNTNICNVNALHNQAIDVPGDGVELVAREVKTEIYQALEHPNYEFAIGVQWHPEYLIQVRRQRRIFKALVRIAQGA